MQGKYDAKWGVQMAGMNFKNTLWGTWKIEVDRK
ncbi:DUF6783 domain-containing protein [uncultured Robinsoniella sp.]